ncbi:MAG TPA: histidine kinase dimerization/phosphoacceptor domain -containing protein [Woeseiaceae bacterium]|nr:histidine kinase dimerization/phosphoacceptor domain -containing protein [Woeseiaceae bacterium]
MSLSDVIHSLRERPLLALAVALFIFLAAFGVRYSFSSDLYAVPFITLLPAILISALIGGTWIGVIVAILSALVAWFWFLPPSATTALRWPDGYLTWALFALTCFIQLYVIHALNQTVEALSRARDRSTALFLELQHRVANNLQFVASMLRMKRRVLELDPTAGDRLFESAQSRLNHMARIHRRLYSPESLELPVEEFFQGLCTDILTARGVQNVNCQANAAQVRLDLQQLVALGLLINEFVTNSAKYAFTGLEAGNISISLEQSDADHLTLTMEDDGRGLPVGLDLTNGTSLGLRIMNSLATQLGGELSWIEVSDGAAAKLVFPLRSDAAQT